MGKLGVGVGEEFPVEEPQATPSPQGEREGGPMREGACAEWRRRREERRARRAQWHALRHAFKSMVFAERCRHFRHRDDDPAGATHNEG